MKMNINKGKMSSNRLYYQPKPKENKRKKLVPLFFAAIACICGAVLFFIYQAQCNTRPEEVLYVSIRRMYPLADASELQVEYVVQNRSEQTVHFLGNQALQVTVNGVQRNFITDSFELAPQEELHLTLLLTGLNLEQSIQVEIGSQTSQGTTAVMRKTFNPLYDP